MVASKQAALSVCFFSLLLQFVISASSPVALVARFVYGYLRRFMRHDLDVSPNALLLRIYRDAQVSTRQFSLTAQLHWRFSKPFERSWWPANRAADFLAVSKQI